MQSHTSDCVLRRANALNEALASPSLLPFALAVAFAASVTDRSPTSTHVQTCANAAIAQRGHLNTKRTELERALEILQTIALVDVADHGRLPRSRNLHTTSHTTYIAEIPQYTAHTNAHPLTTQIAHRAPARRLVETLDLALELLHELHVAGSLCVHAYASSPHTTERGHNTPQRQRAHAARRPSAWSGWRAVRADPASCCSRSRRRQPNPHDMTHVGANEMHMSAISPQCCLCARSCATSPPCARASSRCPIAPPTSLANMHTRTHRLVVHIFVGILQSLAHRFDVFGSRHALRRLPCNVIDRSPMQQR
jgi:hypothetical protein